jgi:nucleolysin TIA-1/TIAR
MNSKGFNYGFVEYDDPGAAERGMATLNGRRIHNNVSARAHRGTSAHRD